DSAEGSGEPTGPAMPVSPSSRSRTEPVPAGAQQLPDRLRWPGPRVVEALREIAAELAQRGRLLGRLHLLRGDLETQRVREAHHGRHHLPVDRVGAVARDERAGELQPVYRQPAQVRQVRVPGAEVVDGDPYSEIGQRAQRLRGARGGTHERALGQLQLQAP